MRFGRPAQAWVALVVGLLHVHVHHGRADRHRRRARPPRRGRPLGLDRRSSAGVTAAYTAWGGLPASLRTDQVQGVMIIVLLAVAIGGDPRPRRRPAGPGPGRRPAHVLPGRLGEHRRARASPSPPPTSSTRATGSGRGRRPSTRVLARAGYGGAAAQLPGAPAHRGHRADRRRGRRATTATEPSPVPFFALLDGLPEVIILLVAVLAVALVASSVDTLQSALAALHGPGPHRPQPVARPRPRSSPSC